MTTLIKRYEFKRGLPQEFEIVDIEYLYKNFATNLTSPHRTEFYHVIWFQKGAPTHWVDFNPVKIIPNTLLFLNKDTVQRFDPKIQSTGKAIVFTDNFFCKTELDTKFLRNTILFNDLYEVSQFQLQHQLKVFTELFQLMTNEVQYANDRFQSDILKNHLHNFLLYSERERRKQNFIEIKKSPDLEYVLLFRDLLERHYRSQKHVAHYARQISITQKRLNQATTKVLGKSPKKIIDDRVLLEAKRILVHTSESIKEIGFDLGFEEPTNFIKYFKKHIHSTPVEFREKFFLA